jgi:DNA repair exonuclease SbcCD ATPase subunit
MKRAGNPVVSAVAKKTKLSPEASKCADIEKALQEADLHKGELAALLGVLHHSLLVPKEIRHNFQHEAVEMVGDVLERIKCDKTKSIPDAHASLQECKQALEKQEHALLQLQDADASKSKVLHEKLHALAGISGRFQTAKAELEAARRKQGESETQLLETVTHKEAVEELLKGIPGLCEDIEKIPAFIENIKVHVELVDTSNLSAISLALAKASDAYGDFDIKVIQELKEKCASRIAIFTETLINGEAAKADCAAEVTAAEKALRVLSDEQIACAEAYTRASEAATAAGEALKEAKKALNQCKRSMRDATQDCSSAEAELEIYSTGPLANFLELRDRTSPAPLQEEEEAAEKEEDSIMGVMHESMCTEMPQAVAVVG